MRILNFIEKEYYENYHYDLILPIVFTFALIILIFFFFVDSSVIRIILGVCEFILLSPIVLYFLYQKHSYKIEVKHFAINLQPQSKDKKQKAKLIFVTDLHINKYFNKEFLDSFINTINSNKPDAIIFGGDYVVDHRTDLNMLNVLSQMKAKEKIAVIGNHDYSILSERECLDGSIAQWKLKRAEDVADKLRSLDIKVLRNENYTTKIGEIPEINFFGLDSDWAKKAIVSKYKPQKFNIVISHEPTHFDEWNFKNVQMVLTGHNHGGQLRLSKALNILSVARKIPGNLKRTYENAYGSYVDGFYKNEYGLQMYCSKGIGLSTISIRINCKPEIVVIDLI
jgi:uncharacterized protein